MRVHLDTDLGGDPDDACALAMLCGWPGVEIVGITTTIDPGGQRAGYVAHCLSLLGRRDIPLAAGAEVCLTSREVARPVRDDERFWPRGIAARPGPAGAALDLLAASIDAGAIVLAIGPYTNLALLEVMRPGSLARTPVVVMGGWVVPAGAGYPDWGPERDWNVQWDPRAAQVVAEAAADLTLSTITASLTVPVRARDLDRLRAAGPVGELLASQSAAHGEGRGLARLGEAHERLPDDLVNFHHDPLACAVAVGWSGAVVQDQRLEAVMKGELLLFRPAPGGRRVRVVLGADGTRFTAAWLTAVEAAAGSAAARGAQ